MVPTDLNFKERNESANHWFLNHNFCRHLFCLLVMISRRFGSQKVHCTFFFLFHVFEFLQNKSLLHHMIMLVSMKRSRNEKWTCFSLFNKTQESTFQNEPPDGAAVLPAYRLAYQSFRIRFALFTVRFYYSASRGRKTQRPT